VFYPDCMYIQLAAEEDQHFIVGEFLRVLFDCMYIWQKKTGLLLPAKTYCSLLRPGFEGEGGYPFPFASEGLPPSEFFA
jgi:hypothetical protein